MWIFALALALPAPGAMALIVQQGEWAGLPPLDGFVLDYHQTAGNQSIEERVPQGETVQDWSRMVTTLRFGGLDDPGRLLDLLGSAWGDGCRSAEVSPRRTVTTAGLKSLYGRMDCSLNLATGKPETFVYRIFASRGTTHMVQVAFRRVPSTADMTWAQTVLDGVVLCSAASAHPQCKR